MAFSGASLDSDTLLTAVTKTKKGNCTYSLIDSLIPHSAFKDEILGNTVAIQQTDKLGILLFLYLISKNFPADAERDKIYQLIKS